MGIYTSGLRGYGVGYNRGDPSLVTGFASLGASFGNAFANKADMELKNKALDIERNQMDAQTNTDRIRIASQERIAKHAAESQNAGLKELREAEAGFQKAATRHKMLEGDIAELQKKVANAQVPAAIERANTELKEAQLASAKAQEEMDYFKQTAAIRKQEKVRGLQQTAVGSFLDEINADLPAGESWSSDSTYTNPDMQPRIAMALQAAFDTDLDPDTEGVSVEFTTNAQGQPVWAVIGADGVVQEELDADDARTIFNHVQAQDKKGRDFRQAEEWNRLSQEKDALTAAEETQQDTSVWNVGDLMKIGQSARSREQAAAQPQGLAAGSPPPLVMKSEAREAMAQDQHAQNQNRLAEINAKLTGLAAGRAGQLNAVPGMNPTQQSAVAQDTIETAADVESRAFQLDQEQSRQATQTELANAADAAAAVRAEAVPTAKKQAEVSAINTESKVRDEQAAQRGKDLALYYPEKRQAILTKAGWSKYTHAVKTNQLFDNVSLPKEILTEQPFEGWRDAYESSGVNPQEVSLADFVALDTERMLNSPRGHLLAEAAGVSENPADWSAEDAQAMMTFMLWYRAENDNAWTNDKLEDRITSSMVSKAKKRMEAEATDSPLLERFLNIWR